MKLWLWGLLERKLSVKDIERRNASNQMVQDSGERRWPEQAEGNMPQRAEASMRI